MQSYPAESNSLQSGRIDSHDNPQEFWYHPKPWKKY